MEPRPITNADLEHWRELDPVPTHFTAPGEVEEGIEPCPGLVLRASNEVAVPWMLDEVALAQLARGGTLWLITRGSLPVHGFVVTPNAFDEHTRLWANEIGPEL
jgi:hypothetical protein